MTYKVFWQLLRIPRVERNHAQLEQDIASLDPLMRIADAQLSQREWLAGADMTLADISFGVLLYRYFTLDIARADLPHLRGYYDRLCARPAYAEHVMVPYESMRVPGA